MKNSAKNSQVGGSHYTNMDVQPWEAIDSWLSDEQAIGFFRGNAIKYLARAGHKGSFIEDIRKAKHYLEALEERLVFLNTGENK